MTVSASATYAKDVDSILTGHTKEQKAVDNNLGRDAFLKMLITQLQYQDPLNPMDGTDFTAQLAQFSALEQQFNINDTLTSILDAVQVKESDNLMDYIGKEVTGEANTLALKDGQATGGVFSLEKPADVAVSIFDDTGSEIRTLYLGQKNPGTTYSIQWDGMDNAGNPVEDGRYTFDITGLSPQGGYVPVETTVSGKVTGVTYEGGTSFLKVGDRLLDPTTVSQVNLSESTGESDGEDTSS